MNNRKNAFLADCFSRLRRRPSESISPTKSKTAHNIHLDKPGFIALIVKRHIFQYSLLFSL
ncbi:MAG: hypothetical protein KBS59_02945, partial [Clostridiales bacterium]|nr:hypothetical protein [Clostridiales bacterium]